jgi:hypothetical protein
MGTAIAKRAAGRAEEDSRKRAEKVFKRSSKQKEI